MQRQRSDDKPSPLVIKFMATLKTLNKHTHNPKEAKKYNIALFLLNQQKMLQYVGNVQQQQKW